MDNENFSFLSNNESLIPSLNMTLTSDEFVSQQSQTKKIKLNETRGGSELRSWIWSYFNPEYKGEVRYAVCQIEIVKGKKCMKTYKTGTSTSNCAIHLANIHGITEKQVSIINNKYLNKNI
jgi:hypothetical protein